MDKTFCELCGDQNIEVVKPDHEDWFDALMDHLIHHKCRAEPTKIIEFLNETDPDGDLLKAYNQGHW